MKTRGDVTVQLKHRFFDEIRQEQIDRHLQVDCPKGWKWVKRIGEITIEDHRVNICDGVSGFG
ncbi:MAG: hypothetical protein ACREA2_04570 [Blastocatellia bacterium]